MFKGILPSSKRGSTLEFTIVNAPVDPGKENYDVLAQPLTTKPQPPQSKFMQKRRMSRSVPKDQPVETNQAFDKLLDDLQIPSTIRPKLNGMEPSVKAAMLKSSQVLASAPKPTTPRGLRKAHSSDSISISSPRPQKQPGYDSVQVRSPSGAVGTDASIHTRGLSIDVPRPASRASGETSSKMRNKDKKIPTSPDQFCIILDNTSSSVLEVETIKKLRLLLRNEVASWTEEFIAEGGYDALLARLYEILEFEWREEQHDDKVLHALLQCFKALSTSAAGCSAIRNSYPSPFLQLVTLIYSDKKPGEIATRQLILEFILLLFDLYRPGSVSSAEANGHRSDSRDTCPSSDLVIIPYPHTNVFSLVRSLLLTPAPRAVEAPEVPLSPHEFIENLHRPRIYKTYLQELSDTCRDYFWVFCHQGNTIWNIRECDEAKAECPRAPGGMTGGVEAEAMRYMTLHLKFINSVANSVAELNLPMEHELSAHKFHSDLFLSGIERIILIARKASTLYYPTLHLEIARYVEAVGIARYELPWSISRLVGPPPSGMSISSSSAAGKRMFQSTPPSSPSKVRKIHAPLAIRTPLNL